MPGLLFNNVWMLAGMAALSIPIVVHLLLKRKKKRLRFSTVQFFLQQDEQSSQRRKLRNWLLLSLRLLICALLVLAFARPYLPNAGGAGAASRKRVVILLDRSLSMQARGTDGPQWTRARESVRQILSGLGPDDRAALVGCGPGAEVLSAWAPASVVTKALADLQPTCAAANLSDGLQQAGRLFSMAEAKAGAVLYIVSDFQRNSCQNLAAAPLPVAVELKLVKIGDLVSPNLSVADLQLEAQQNTAPHALVVSFSDEESRGLKLDLKVDGTVAGTQVFDLGAGSSTNLELTVPGLKPGWHDVAVHLQTSDALGLDDTRFQSVFVPTPSRVLVAEDRPSPRSYEEGSFFVRMALDPAEGASGGVQSRFVCEKVAPETIGSRLTLQATARSIDWVVLPGLKNLPGALGPALLSYVRAGGGVLFFLGEAVSANHYNAEFRELLPVQLSSVETSPRPDVGWRLGTYETNAALFTNFQQPNSGNLHLPRFFKRFAFAGAEGSSVVARFEDGVPAVLVREVGRGRVVLVNSSADTEWNDWPKHKTFVPWLHDTGLFLAGIASAQSMNNEIRVVAGTDRDLDLGTNSAKAEFKLRLPEGKEIPITADQGGQLRDLPLASPGIYVLRDRTGAEVRRVAVNVPVQEMELTAVPATDFQQRIVRVPETPATTLTAGLFGASGNQKEFWRVLLMAVVLLLFVEMLVANRTLA